MIYMWYLKTNKQKTNHGKKRDQTLGFQRQKVRGGGIIGRWSKVQTLSCKTTRNGKYNTMIIANRAI